MPSPAFWWRVWSCQCSAKVLLPCFPFRVCRSDLSCCSFPKKLTALDFYSLVIRVRGIHPYCPCRVQHLSQGQTYLWVKIETECFANCKENWNDIWLDCVGFMEEVACQLGLEGWVGFWVLVLDRSTLLNDEHGHRRGTCNLRSGDSFLFWLQCRICEGSRSIEW